MNWKYLTRASLLGCILTLLGCHTSPGNSDGPDASTGTDAGTDASTPDTDSEWDGGYVPLEENGNSFDPGRLSPCRFAASGGGGCDFNTFDLSACDQGSLANAGTEGEYMLTLREQGPDPDGEFYYTEAAVLTLSGDGGTSYLNGVAATEVRQGNARLFSTTTLKPDGSSLRYAAVTCEAPQAPEFTGCYTNCRNGKLLSLSTFKSERMKWRAGESEASGLELVSESHVEQGHPVDVYVTKGYAYVVAIDSMGQTGGLTVFDVSNKAAPVKVKTIHMENDSYWNAAWAKGDALYVASADRGVLLFDITHPADPKLVRNLPGGSGRVNNHTLFIEGDRLYATTNNSVSIFDVSTPLAPVELNRYAPVSEFPNSPHDMLAVGDRLYVNNAIAGYVVADVSNPSDIRTLGQFDYPGQYSHANAVGTFAGRTIAFVGGEGPFEHLRVLDVTDPANIVKIGEFQLRPTVSIHNMLLVGKKLYISWYQEGVRVLNVANPTKPTQVAYYNTWRETDPHRGQHLDGAIGIRIPGDGYIYVVDTSRGLLILREK
ncbi:LVIVD repeat-containing protein [Vitiosangium sp. GDMCC 1.1324]|uniref:LVIVD repeat-containing protein n=1 Tax=Vitiosangium sp. (strain GDMCC 1.1324) TaxID=2138576 RepID=UPI000D351B28|nr:hypothetical protein [Vitiosangium sp. GDMCC 1.1324]PTL79578.1 hypothetical protein DAT35_32720 [Vitiosangium sp. GDMCC 1.1324]